MANVLQAYYRVGIARELTTLFSSSDLSDKYEGLAISGHIAAYHDAIVSEFLSTNSKPYFVDPYTFVFQFENKLVRSTESKNGSADDETQVKLSVMKLAECCGKPLTTCVDEKRTVLLTDFGAIGNWDEHLIKEFVTKVVKFQKSRTSHQQTSLDMLLEWAQMPPGQRGTRSPAFILPPYFLCDGFDHWYDLSLMMAKVAKEVESEIPIYPVIALEESTLSSADARSRLVDDYRGFEGCFLWINRLNESEAGTDVLTDYGRLVKALASSGLRVFSLYGGVFSAFLSKVGLSGFVSGVCYNDYKIAQAKPGGGKIRYYSAQVCKKLSIADAIKFYSTFPTVMCNCKYCRQVPGTKGRLGSKQFARSFFPLLIRGADHPDTIVRSHFLLKRAQELAYIAESSADVIIEDCRSSAQQYGGAADVGNLLNWATAFRELTKRTEPA